MTIEYNPEKDFENLALSLNECVPWMIRNGMLSNEDLAKINYELSGIMKKLSERM